MTRPETGARAEVICLRPPLVNRKEGVWLWAAGDCAWVQWSGYWQGLFDQGVIDLAPPAPDPETPRGHSGLKNHKDGCRCVVCRTSRQKG